ncbi:hypothetical protein [Nocardia wallacei]|uniref:hypothetical protein n=1 Tax=Nocardia wallacei TaxID=480035 RepID=UPI002456B8CF|nr:hypothetical protein [Nocardia wallacei]
MTNPEQHVLDEIDCLAATDDIAELVDWQIEQGIRRGDAPAWMLADRTPVRIEAAALEITPETSQQLHAAFVQIGEQLRPIVQAFTEAFRQLAEALAPLAQQFATIKARQPTQRQHGPAAPGRRHTPPYPVLPYRDPRPQHQRVTLAPLRHQPPPSARQAGRHNRGRR